MLRIGNQFKCTFNKWVAIVCHGCLVFLSISSIAWGRAVQDAQLPAEPGSIVAKLSAEVPQVQALVAGAWTKNWVQKVTDLPTVQPKKIDVAGKEIAADEATYYSARFGSPLAYSRALDLAEQHGFHPQPNSRVVDFGYGSIGHLRMLALAGIDVTGIDVAPLLPKLYEDASGKLNSGNVQLLHGSFPVDKQMLQELGDGYDLFLSKNTLKRGYIHPSREANDRMLIRLGVSDQEFLNQVNKLLKPKGLFVIYNFCPAKTSDDKPYIPWAEGESPFSKADFEVCGFELLAFDIIDDMAARKLAHALAWDTEAKMDLENDLFAWYTIARKK